MIRHISLLDGVFFCDSTRGDSIPPSDWYIDPDALKTCTCRLCLKRVGELGVAAMSRLVELQRSAS